MSLEQSKIAFIGSGAMAEAIIKGILGKGLIASERIIASDPVPARTRRPRRSARAPHCPD